MDREAQSIEERVQAIATALDNLDTQDRAAVRDIAAIIRWGREKLAEDRARRADLMRNALVVMFSIFASVVAGLILAKLK